MGIEGILFPGTAVSDVGPNGNEGRSARLLLRRGDGLRDGLHVISICDGLDMPSVGFEPFRYVFRKGQTGLPGKGDAIIVVEIDQSSEFQMTRQRSRLGGHPFHQVSVAHDAVSIVIDDVMTRPVKPRCQMALRNRHPHAVWKTLAQRPRRALHAGSLSMLRMTRGLASPLSEALDLLQRQIISCQMKQGIKQRRTVTGRQDETVPVGPQRIPGMMPQKPVPEDIGHRARPPWACRGARSSPPEPYPRPAS